MAAAHRTLPFGTRVRVENLNNGRSVVVSINDRGPSQRNRIIDLSRAAAQRLGYIKAGITQVRVSIDGDAKLQGVPCSGTGASDLASNMVPEPRVRPQSPSDTMVERFAVAFQEDDWFRTEMARAMEALFEGEQPAAKVNSSQ